jgi:hypothetical protein
MQDNTIESDVFNAYNNTAALGASDHFDNLCLIGNRIYDTATAIYLRSNMPSVKATDNALDGGIFRMGSNVYVDQSGNTSGCFVASPLLD